MPGIVSSRLVRKWFIAAMRPLTPLSLLVLSRLDISLTRLVVCASNNHSSGVDPDFIRLISSPFSKVLTHLPAERVVDVLSLAGTHKDNAPSLYTVTGHWHQSDNKTQHLCGCLSKRLTRIGCTQTNERLVTRADRAPKHRVDLFSVI